MPGKETILARTNYLPTVESPVVTGLMYSDDQIWEGDEEQAHFKVTKEKLPYPQLPSVYALSVSGKKKGIEKIIADFKTVFGEPLIRNMDSNLQGFHFVLWNAEEVDKKRNGRQLILISST